MIALLSAEFSGKATELLLEVVVKVKVIIVCCAAKAGPIPTAKDAKSAKEAKPVKIICFVLFLFLLLTLNNTVRMSRKRA